LHPTDPKALKRKEKRTARGTRRERGEGAFRQARVKAVIFLPVLGRKRGKGARPPSPVGRGALERSPQARLEEAVGLAAAIDLDVVASGVVPVPEPRPATLFGSGKVEELKGLLLAEEAGLVIVDHALTPVQQRNLETAWKVKVLDRTGLILEIFGARARTREGRLQVELAHLVYQKSRLVRSWTHLERQRGGFGFLGGPGETQIEADRRIIGERIDKIRQELEHVRQTRRLHRESRQRVPYPSVALVGYTNAGKSTLFNALTGSTVLAEDTLFATLDPTIRALSLPGGSKAVLSDTVGFISELPTTLIAAFRATLEEVLEADLILHVRAIADEASASQRSDVNAVLLELGIDAEGEPDRLLEVWNKADLLDEAALRRAQNEAPRTPAVLVSAVTGLGLDGLRAEIERRLNLKRETIEIAVKPEEGALSNWIYENCEVLSRKTLGEGITALRIRIAPEKRERLARLAGPARLRIAAE
jgi:GTP-binding protein HflX